MDLSGAIYRTDIVTSSYIYKKYTRSDLARLHMSFWRDCTEAQHSYFDGVADLFLVIIFFKKLQKSIHFSDRLFDLRAQQ